MPGPTPLRWWTDSCRSPTSPTRDGPDELAVARDLQELGSVLHVRLHPRAYELASRRGWVRFHGVTADVGGRRVIAIGPSGVGKTTLALGLLAHGIQVQGDESVLRREARSLAVPRRLQVKVGSGALVPEAAGWLAQATPMPAAPHVLALEPRVSGVPWRTVESRSAVVRAVAEVTGRAAIHHLHLGPTGRRPS